jgi:hypothetical protein
MNNCFVMKNTVFILFLIAACSYGCKKDHSQSNNELLARKWELKQMLPTADSTLLNAIFNCQADGSYSTIIPSKGDTTTGQWLFVEENGLMELLTTPSSIFGEDPSPVYLVKTLSGSELVLNAQKGAGPSGIVEYHFIPIK